jgi:GNAT superfamily N-acetyltransferase
MSSAVVRELGRPGDLGWVLQAHGELYAAEYAWSVEAVTARIVADYAEKATPDRDAAWIAELDGQRVGSVFCVRDDDETARLRLLLVDPHARGHGLGRRLVERCIAFARDAGYRRLVLWTNDPLAAARHLYLDAGFRLIAQERHHEFGPELLGQEYELNLVGTAQRA